jgi:hypothetical protein
VERWTDHSRAAAGDQQSEGQRQREELPGRWSPTHRPSSLVGESIVEEQGRWDRWWRLAGGTLALQAGERGEEMWAGRGTNTCVLIFTWGSGVMRV